MNAQRLQLVRTGFYPGSIKSVPLGWRFSYAKAGSCQNAGSSDVKEYRQNFDFGPNTIHEIYLDNVKNDSSTLGSYKVSHGVSTVFLLDGYAFVNGTNYKIYQGNVFKRLDQKVLPLRNYLREKMDLAMG